MPYNISKFAVAERAQVLLPIDWYNMAAKPIDSQSSLKENPPMPLFP
jgi:hypothetical protein